MLQKRTPNQRNQTERRVDWSFSQATSPVCKKENERENHTNHKRRTCRGSVVDVGNSVSEYARSTGVSRACSPDRLFKRIAQGELWLSNQRHHRRVWTHRWCCPAFLRR